MKRTIFAVVLVMLVGVFVQAQTPLAKSLSDVKAMKVGQQKPQFFKPYGKGFAVSSAVYAGGAIADMLTSRGKLERNPLTRDDSGVFKLGPAIALTTVPYALSLLFERKHPKLASFMRIALGGFRFAAAGYNTTNRRVRFS